MRTFAVLACVLTLGSHAQAQTRGAIEMGVVRSEAQDQTAWFLTRAFGSPVALTPSVISSLRDKKTYASAFPKMFSELARARPHLVWLPSRLVLGDNTGALGRFANMAASGESENCQVFNDRFRECLSYIPIQSPPYQGALVEVSSGSGVAACQTFVSNKDRRENFYSDCEPLVMRYGDKEYVRAIATVAGTVVTPGFRDKAISFQYRFSSTDFMAVRSPKRVAEFLDGLTEASGLPPLALAADRGDAENVIIARSAARYSNELKVWEKVSLQLTTSSERKRDHELDIRVTGRLFVLVNRENVDRSEKWHEPDPAQNQKYEQMVATNVINGAKAVCDKYAQSIGRAGFSYNVGAVVSLNCSHPAP